MFRDLDPFSPAWREDPYPLYRHLRDNAPVHHVASLDAWCVSRYEDAQAVLKDPETFSSRAMFSLLANNGADGVNLSWAGIKLAVHMLIKLRISPWTFSRARNLIASDGARHRSMRNIVNSGFTPRRVACSEARIQELVDECLVPLREGGEFELVRDLAIPLPVTIIAELLGVEKERHGDFKRWSETIIHNTSGPGRKDPFNAPFIQTMEEIFAYFDEAILARHANPTDDLIGTILASQQGEADPLSVFEMIQFIVLLMLAGNETTTNLIGNGTAALLANPEELQRALDDPGLAAQIVEETVRYDPPVQNVFRTATETTEIRGVTIPKGAYVAVLVGSANRDERRFPDPDRFDLSRDTRGHLGFGLGEHFCLGSSLARLEGRLAFQALVPELVGVMPPKETGRIDSFLVRGVARMPLRMEA
ncbi:MAG: cytochrome P450 [Deltaproteobacteria bacterium]|nr:cytochrome P450 [Deltaproteobacteria bacterium]MBW2396191.1 cytochrome P450 [Deltaproteobacteria bacterium]